MVKTGKTAKHCGCLVLSHLKVKRRLNENEAARRKCSGKVKNADGKACKVSFARTCSFLRDARVSLLSALKIQH